MHEIFLQLAQFKQTTTKTGNYAAFPSYILKIGARFI